MLTKRVISSFRTMWQRVSAVRLFVEHVCPPGSLTHPADVRNIFLLWKVGCLVIQRQYFRDLSNLFIHINSCTHTRNSDIQYKHTNMQMCCIHKKKLHTYELTFLLTYFSTYLLTYKIRFTLILSRPLETMLISPVQTPCESLSGF